MTPVSPGSAVLPMELNRFLVFGLGSLGQHCVAALSEFGVKVVGVEASPPPDWEIPRFPELLEDLVIGDGCQDAVLRRAQIQHCRAALIVTSHERVNAETAIAIRQLNPHSRLVIRSGQSNLNQLLSEQLGNFVAFDPTELPATAFAIAALGTDTLGFFNLEGHWLRVASQTIEAGNPWCNFRRVGELDSRNRRLLIHYRPPAPPPQSFHAWELDTLVQAGDILISAETAEQFLSAQTRRSRRSQAQRSRFLWQSWRWASLSQRLWQFWQLSWQQQVQRAAFVCALTTLILLGVGTVLFHNYHPDTTWMSAFYVTSILLLGGYSDLFDDFSTFTEIPGWLQFFALSLTVSGIAIVGVLYALLTQALLSARFQFAKRRPPVPPQDHVVLIGFGRVCQRVALLLQEFQQSLVAITLNPDFDLNLFPSVPLIRGTKESLLDLLAKANVSRAKSVVVATDDEILNLEAGLAARGVNPEASLALRTYGQRLSNHLSKLFPNDQVLCTYAVMGEAFAGAAFGENILGLFRLHNQTILVTEYRIEDTDTLHGLLLSEVAYGYGVVPLLHQTAGETSRLLPSDDICLRAGDRLVVLASSASLRRIELGEAALRQWTLELIEARNSSALFVGGNILARISGCPLSEARELMNQLPTVLRSPLYRHQAQRLARELQKAQIKTQLCPFGPPQPRPESLA